MSDVEARAADAIQVPSSLEPAQLGPLIARSSKCEVFAFGDSVVVKFFPLGTAAHEVRRQIGVARIVSDSGINAPWVCDTLTRHAVDGRLGAIYQRREGRTLTRMLADRPIALLSIARLLAAEHRQLHSRPSIDSLPIVRKRVVDHLAKDPYLSAAQKASLRAIVDALPDGDRVCHGDFCWDNLLVSTSQTSVLDWADAGIGDPVCDVARTWVLINFNDNSDSAAVRWPCRLLGMAYFRAYIKGNTQDMMHFRQWRVVNAALRLRDLPDRLHPWIHRFVDRELAALEVGRR